MMHGPPRGGTSRPLTLNLVGTLAAIADPLAAAGMSIFEEICHPIAERLLARCDAVLRVGGASHGADLMVRVARERGLAVFSSLREVPGCG
jgi:hypothetical protein